MPLLSMTMKLVRRGDERVAGARGATLVHSARREGGGQCGDLLQLRLRGLLVTYSRPELPLNLRQPRSGLPRALAHLLVYGALCGEELCAHGLQSLHRQRRRVEVLLVADSGGGGVR